MPGDPPSVLKTGRKYHPKSHSQFSRPLASRIYNLQIAFEVVADGFGQFGQLIDGGVFSKNSLSFPHDEFAGETGHLR